MSDNKLTNKPLTIAECQRLAERLSGVSDSGRIDVDVLLAKALGRERAYLYTWPDQYLSLREQQMFKAMLERRERGEPIAHIIGEKEFWSLTFYVDSSTLIPRPDTELLVEQALQLLLPRLRDTNSAKPAKILDLGTGSGVIAIAIATERSHCKVDAVDNSAQALSLAQRNKQRHKVDNLHLWQSCWFNAVNARDYDMIVSNPPYIHPCDSHLQLGDLQYEPRSALVSEGEGLADIEKIVSQAQAFMRPGAWLLLEHGNEQARAVRNWMLECTYIEVDTALDLNGHERVTYGRKP